MAGMEEEDAEEYEKMKKEVKDKIEKDEEREKRFADIVADSFYNIIDIIINITANKLVLGTVPLLSI